MSEHQEKAAAPRPVTDWENEKVKRHALCDPYLWEDYKNDVEELREREAQYRASLPTDPEEGYKAIRELLHPGFESYPSGFKRALHLVTAIEELVRKGDLDVSYTQESLAYLAESAAEGLRDTQASLDRIGDILSAPRSKKDQEVEEFRGLTKDLPDAEKRGLALAMTATIERGVPIKEALAIFDEERLAKDAAQKAENDPEK